MSQQLGDDRQPADDRYRAVTRAIEVSVRPVYLDGQSTPDEGHFVWAYQVRIENIGMETVQLINRYWRITDAHGRVKEVRGPGVVGEQPVLAPGVTFEYTSGTPLSTPSGIMVGHYGMVTEEGQSFQVDIPAFSLDRPDQAIRLN